MLRTALVEPGLQILDADSVYRRVTVRPGMCGHNSLFIGQLGDWTWETVSALCGTNVFAARNSSGTPTYLAFYYFHLKASRSLHPGKLSFGNQIEVASKLFNFGSESILTLHKIKLAPDHESETGRTFECREFYDDQNRDCIYVENFNRWITRSQEKSNEALVKSSPVDFRYAHLPVLPDVYSPRRAYSSARDQHTFHDSPGTDFALRVDEFCVEYGVDITRDINGVGLIYFAAYFSIIDWAMLQLWKHLGRSDRSFMERIILDQKVCYLGNADIDSVFTIKLKLWEKIDESGEAVIDVLIEERETRRMIAVCTVQMLAEHHGNGTHSG